jgi:phosphatidylglycerophosphate synthase
MLSARLGHFLDIPLGFIAKRIPFSPNVLSITGFLITAAAAFIIPHHLVLGGIFLMIGGIFDMLDGIVARTTGRATKFGAFLDSVLDRYSDAFLFLSIAWYLAAHGDHTGSFLSIGTLVGAFLISYARARRKDWGKTATWPCRPERIILLIFATLTGWIVPVLWVMLVQHATVIQRMYYVVKAMKK